MYPYSAQQTFYIPVETAEISWEPEVFLVPIPVIITCTMMLQSRWVGIFYINIWTKAGKIPNFIKILLVSFSHLYYTQFTFINV